jgi:hypothetical protein
MLKPGSGCAEAALDPCAGVPVLAGRGLGAWATGAGEDFIFASISKVDLFRSAVPTEELEGSKVGVVRVNGLCRTNM